AEHRAGKIVFSDPASSHFGMLAPRPGPHHRRNPDVNGAEGCEVGHVLMEAAPAADGGVQPPDKVQGGYAGTFKYYFLDSAKKYIHIPAGRRNNDDTILSPNALTQEDEAVL